MGIILNNNLGNKVSNTLHVSDRLQLITLETNPITIIIQIYMPTSSHQDSEVDEVYEQLDDILRGVKVENDLYIMGDFNAVVGEEEDVGVVGKWGLGKKNARGERLVHFCYALQTRYSKYPKGEDTPEKCRETSVVTS